MLLLLLKEIRKEIAVATDSCKTRESVTFYNPDLRVYTGAETKFDLLSKHLYKKYHTSWQNLADKIIWCLSFQLVSDSNCCILLLFCLCSQRAHYCQMASPCHPSPSLFKLIINHLLNSFKQLAFCGMLCFSCFSDLESFLKLFCKPLPIFPHPSWAWTPD